LISHNIISITFYMNIFPTNKTKEFDTVQCKSHMILQIALDSLKLRPILEVVIIKFVS